MDKQAIMQVLKNAVYQSDFRKRDLKYWQSIYNKFLEAQQKGFLSDQFHEADLDHYLVEYSKASDIYSNSLAFEEDTEENNITIYINKVLQQNLIAGIMSVFTFQFPNYSFNNPSAISAKIDRVSHL